MTTAHRPAQREWLALGAYTLAIWLTIVASFKLGFAGDNVIAIWPAAGLCAWISLRYGWKCIPVVFVSHQSYSLLFQDGPTAMYLIANAINALACFIAAAVFRHLGGTTAALGTVRNTLLFVTVYALTLAGVAAVFGTLTVITQLALPMDQFPGLAWRWFFSDYSGVVLIAPSLIALHGARAEWSLAMLKSALRHGWRPMLVCTAVVGTLYLTTFSMPRLGQYPIVLLTMPLCIWLALNHNARTCTILLSLAIISSLATVLAAVGDVTQASFLAVQLYGVAVMCTSLVLQATSQERSVLIATLDRERELLEQKVASRTSALKLLAETDTLTGLANRRSFESALDDAFQNVRDHQSCHYLLYIDLDEFKSVNDTSGHAAGDALLRQVTDILKSNVRSSDMIGRLGGDEFGVLLLDCLQHVALNIAEKTRVEIDTLRFDWGDCSHRIGASIGVTRIDASYNSLANIKQRADAACYTAKNSGRNRIHLAGTADLPLIASQNDDIDPKVDVAKQA